MIDRVNKEADDSVVSNKAGKKACEEEVEITLKKINTSY